MTNVAEVPGRASEAQSIEEVINNLRGRFPNVDAQPIAELVHSIYSSYVEARIREFIPLLVERSASDTLAETSKLPTWSS